MSDDATSPALEQLLGEQRDLTRLGLRDLLARYEAQPVTSRVHFGAGEAETKTIEGNPQVPFHAVAIENATLKTIFVGFSPTAARGALLQVPPMSMLVWPAQYSDLSLGVTGVDATSPVAAVLVARLPFPVEPALYSLAQPTLANPATGLAEVQRTPSKFIPLGIAGLTVPATTPTALWTPTAGKRFRLLGFQFGNTAAGAGFQLLDGNVPFYSSVEQAGDNANGPPNWQNGYLSIAIGNALNIEFKFETTTFGSLWGTEE